MMFAPSRASTGTWTLVRFNLRKDRIKIPVWVLGISVFMLYYATALPEVFPDQAALQSMAQFMTGPIGAVMGGPGYGAESLTLERLIVGVYGLYFLLAVALMNILLISRHTRVDEEAGRLELIRANVVGRSAPLNAALLTAVIANVLLTLLFTGAMLSADYAADDSLLFAAGLGALGLAFAGLTALTAQVSEYSRAGSGMAGAALGVAYVVRAIGDMLEPQGSLLSWFSPIAWSQQTRAFVDGRWWPLLLSVAFAAVTAALAYRLSSRRDVGHGLVAARPGPATAAPRLRSPLALSLRLQRANIVGWSIALLLGGLAFGGTVDAMGDSFSGMSDDLLAIMGGSDQITDGYLGLMGFVMALVVSVYGILSVHRLCSEEVAGRLEPVLATATSRWAVMGSHLLVTMVSAVGLLFVAGLGTGLGAAAVSGEGAHVWELTVAHVAHAPGVLVVLGTAALLFGALPRAVNIVWIVPVYAMLVGFFGPMLDLPEWMPNLSPLNHIAQLPLEDFTLAPVLILTAIAVGTLVAGLPAFRRRDLVTN